MKALYKTFTKATNMLKYGCYFQHSIHTQHRHI